MLCKKSLNINFLLSLLLVLLLFSYFNYAQQEEEQKLTYHRNDNTFLENYNSSDKEKYFPLSKLTFSTGVWTELNPNVPRVDYIGIDFINPDTGWACGLWGAVIKTTNAGQDWSTAETPTGEILLKVHSCSGQVVMIVGHNGTILRSSDGGESFSLLTGITTQELWGVKMLNDAFGWICGRNQTLLKTTDSGLTWQPVVTGFNYHYWQFDFLTEDYFMIACSQGKVLKTTNGGLSFTQHQAGNTEDLYTIDIIDSLHIAAAGYFGKNVYSSNGGITWIENQQLTSLPVNWIEFINSDIGYAVVESSISMYKTTNRGQSWALTGFNRTGEWQFELLNDSLGYGVGAGLKVTKTEDGFNTGENLFLNDSFRDVFFLKETTGFALSWQLYKTTDSGLSWHLKENAPGGYDILFLDSLTGFIGGTERLFKTTNGGETWYEPNGVPAGIGRVDKIFFINSLTGWAIKSRNILKTNDGGENWFVQFTHPSLGFSSIHFVDSLCGWTSGGRPQKTTDGGHNWIEQTNTDIWNSDDVYLTSWETGWIGKYSSIFNSLFKTTDGGLNWIGLPEVVGARKFYFFPDPIHWIIIGFSQYYITSDFGSSWIEFTEDVPIGLVSFYAPTNNLGYAVGNNGLVLKYDDTTYVPVELISFDGILENSKIVLTWVTASELNNFGFYVERSCDYLSWETIGFVNGNGTTTNTNYYNFIDHQLTHSQISYRLKQTDYTGTFTYSEVIEIIFPIKEFMLMQNFPNPFNNTTIITYQIPSEDFITLKVYDVLGNAVATLIEENKKAGYYSLNFSADDLSSGIYFYKLIAGNYRSTKKFILLK